MDKVNFKRMDEGTPEEYQFLYLKAEIVRLVQLHPRISTDPTFLTAIY